MDTQRDYLSQISQKEDFTDIYILVDGLAITDRTDSSQAKTDLTDFNTRTM